MSNPPKARVRSSFDRAAASYDNAAAVQRRICQHLLARLLDFSSTATALPARILDAGCGTGYALSQLQSTWEQAACIALDFSPAMLQHTGARPGVHRLAGDIEHLPLATGSIDLYWSSLAVQWCELAPTLSEARRVLAPGGRLAIASLGPATFSELRLAFAGVDRHAHTLLFQQAEDMRQAARIAGFSIVDVLSHQETAYYPDFRSLLRAVKAVGANQVGAGRRATLLGRAAFNQAEIAAETLRTAQGLPLSYDVITLLARA